jgi:hypothetical protein
MTPKEREETQTMVEEAKKKEESSSGLFDTLITKCY